MRFINDALISKRTRLLQGEQDSYKENKTPTIRAEIHPCGKNDTLSLFPYEKGYFSRKLSFISIFLEKIEIKP